MTARSPEVEALLSRVRSAVRAQPVQVPTAPAQDVVRRIARGRRDLVELFVGRAQAVGMRVTRTSRADLTETLGRLASAHAGDAGRIVVAARDGEIAACAREASGGRLARNDDADLLFECAVGVTDVDAAIAESGSLVISTNGRIRNAWVTPPTHVAIVREGQILADLVDLFEEGAEALDAASTTIVTGPSKTADIEGVLVTGVHGPGAVEIVLLA